MDERQLFIARSLALGESVAQIAEELAVSESTVRMEINKMRGLTGLETHTQLAGWCVSQGLVTLGELQEAYSYVQLGPAARH